MSRRLQDARTEAARWRAWCRRMGTIAREMLLAPIGGHDDRPDQAVSWRGVERIPGSSPFASGGPVGLMPGEVPAILSRGHELPFRGHPYSFASLDGLELGRGDELMEEVKAKVRAAHQAGAEAVLCVIEDGVAREVGRVAPGGLQLQLDRKPRW